MQIGVVGPDGSMVARTRDMTNADRGPDAVLDTMAAGVRRALEEAGLEASSLGAVGIGAPGAIELGTGVVIEAPNLRWNHFPLGQSLQDRLGCPIVVENDVNAAIVGEHRAGAGRGSDDVLGVWIGTGIGGGLILNGRLHHGAFGTAGEIGQTILFPGGAHGHRILEDVCSRKSAVGRLSELVHSNRASSLIELAGGDAGAINAAVVAKAYASGDELTREVIDQTAALIGTCIANTLTVLSMSAVVLGGGLTEAIGAPFVDGVAAAMRRDVFPSAVADRIRVVPTELADNAGLLGAAFLAQDVIRG